MLKIIVSYLYKHKDNGIGHFFHDAVKSLINFTFIEFSLFLNTSIIGCITVSSCISDKSILKKNPLNQLKILIFYFTNQSRKETYFRLQVLIYFFIKLSHCHHQNKKIFLLDKFHHSIKFQFSLSLKHTALLRSKRIWNGLSECLIKCWS